MRGFVGYLGGPQVGAEDFVADAVGGYAAGEQGGADVPHERQRPAGEDLDVGIQGQPREADVALRGPVVGGGDAPASGGGSQL